MRSALPWWLQMASVLRPNNPDAAPADSSFADSLLNGVAATTTHRDRDELNHALVRLLAGFLETQAITMLRVIHDGSVKRLEQKVRMSRREGEQSSFAQIDDSEERAALSDFALLEQCAVRCEIAQDTTADGALTTVFPIRSDLEVAGLLVMETPKPLSSRETDLVLGVLEILRNHIALLDYGELDTLTGLLNRKTFEAHFDKLRRKMAQQRAAAAAGAKTTAESCWLALIDIDHFKSINDRYGHLFGDEILLLVSGLMKQVFRHRERLFRFGGEEFVAVLDNANDAGARSAFERLRMTVEQFNFPQVGRVTISLGYTRIDASDVPELCVERADAALYYAKNHGRNHVRFWEELIASGAIASKDSHGEEVELF